MAVYSKKDYENYLNRDKIKKKKRRKKIRNILIIVGIVGILASIVLLLFRDKENFIKTDNITDAINFAIDKFAEEIPTSHNNYPRLSYDTTALPSITPNNPVEDTNNNLIFKEYGDKTEEEQTNKEETKDKDTTTNNLNTETNKEETTQKPNKSKYYEYDHFEQIAGKGNFPGYGIMGKDFIKDIRKELMIAVKAHTTLPLAQKDGAEQYYIDEPGGNYDYVYFFLAGEVKKVDKTYLLLMDDSDYNKTTYDIYDFWISLTQDKSSGLAAMLLNSSANNNFTVAVSDAKKTPITGAKVSLVVGSYIETVFAENGSVVIFRNVPMGFDADVRIEKDGYIDFPHEIAYHNYEVVEIKANEDYRGSNISAPFRVEMLNSSAAKCSFSYTTLQYQYGGNGYTVSQEHIGGNFTMKITNLETKETTEKVVGYEEDGFYWCQEFPDMQPGKYDIEIYPTNKRYDTLKLKGVFINEHGLSLNDYLTKNEDFIFAFNTDGTVNVKFEIIDDTSYGLSSPKGSLDMYQMIKSNVQKDGGVEIKFDGSKPVSLPLAPENGKIIGSIDVDQNAKYDIYLSTIYGDILLYKDFNVRTNNYQFSAIIKDETLPQCIAEIKVNREISATIEIANTANTKETYRFKRKDGTTNEYQLNIVEPMQAGYYFLNFYDNEGILLETYMILISNKSNNTTIDFS